MARCSRPKRLYDAISNVWGSKTADITLTLFVIYFYDFVGTNNR